MTKSVEIGVIGLGKMGMLHAGILNALPSCQVTTIVEKEGMLVKFAKKLLPDLRYYPDVGSMLAGERDIDAVWIATPISSHLPILREIVADRKKIAVFVEKPLAGDYGEAKKMVELSEWRGLQTMVGFQKRFSPVFKRGKEMLSAGVLGEPISFSAYSYVSNVFSKGKSWRFKARQGGALLDLGPHLIDILLWYFGKPAGVKGSTRSVYSLEVDDFAEGSLEFDSGIKGSFQPSWSVEGYRLPEIGIRIVGRSGILQVTDDYLKLELYSDAAILKAGKYHFKRPDFDWGVDFLIGDPEFCLEDKNFIDCVMKGESPMLDFRVGLGVNDVIERIFNSSGNAGVT